MFYLNRVILLSSTLLATTLNAQTYQGILDVVIEDHFDTNQSKTIYHLQEDNDSYLLDIPTSLYKKNLISGLPVLIEGDLKSALGKNNNVIKVHSIRINQTKLKMMTTLSPVTNSRKILSLLVNFTDKKTTDTVTVNDVDSILYQSNLSLLKNFNRNSFGQITFVRDVNGNGNAGIFTINLNYAIGDACNNDQWAKDAKLAATQTGINLNQYQHFMFILPADIKCDWGGLGNLGCGPNKCNTWIRGYNPKLVYSQMVYSHEIGHNLGIDHSATDKNNNGRIDNEYGDAACIMGVGDFKYFSELNAPHRDQMHWFDGMPNRVKTVNADGQFTLNPLDAGMDKEDLIALKIPKNSTETYYVSYRKSIGPFAAISPDYVDKVSIHRTKQGDNHTYFIKALKAGETFVDAKNNIAITAEKTTDVAVISVKK